MPVVLAGFKEDAVTGADDLDRAAFALAQPDALGDVDGLSVRMGAPGVKWTLAAAKVEVLAGAAIASI